MDIQYLHPSGYDVRERLAEAPCATGEECALIGGDAFSFKDFLDVINPLQQLPIVGSLYRQATGDTLSTGARLAGGFLLGGPIGFMVAAFNAGLQGATGGDVSDHMLASIPSDSSRQYALNAYRRTDQLT
jgi:hypothetical protein